MARATGKLPTRANPASESKHGTPARRGRASRAAGSVMRRHGRDIGGLGAIVAGLLVAGSVWISAAGTLGEGINWVLAAGVGLVSTALPVGLAALGVVALRGTLRAKAPARARREDGSPDGGDGGDDSGAADAAGAGSDSMARVMLGGVMLMVSATGLLHLARGRPGMGDSVDDLGAAGGVVGVAVGGFLHAWTAVWGSVLMLVFVGLVGAIVVTQLTVRAVAAWLLRLARPAWRALRSGIVNLFSDIREAPPGSQTEPAPPGVAPAAEAGSESVGAGEQAAPAALGPAPAPAAKPAPKRPAVGADASRSRSEAPSKWRLPPLELLASTPTREVDRAEVAERGQLLQATLARFEVPTKLLAPVVGPTVTRFVLELGDGVKVAKLESLRKDIAYAMASPDVRILAPIPGRRAIGVEVPNLDRRIVSLGDVLVSAEAVEAEHPLEVAVGRDINGRSVMMNLATTPHLLIAGATGAGKSSCLNSLITSVLMRSMPDEVRMILVDPKRVEMGQYDRAPHLLTAPVTDPRKAANALAWAVREMERRYDLLHKVGFRDITGYNAAVDDDTLKPPPGERDSDGEPLRYRRLPFVLVVVDELADLMMVAARDVEESIARLAQMARAVGIHLVIATQRPSVNIITGVIKANIPARLAFAVSSLTDSRVILDQPGAERLVGQGDMLWLSPTSSTPHRIQGCWVTEDEVRSVVAHWVDQAPDFHDDPAVSIEGADSREFGRAVKSGHSELPLSEPDLGGAPNMPSVITEAPPAVADDDSDDLLEAAMALVVETQLGSTSMLQRRLRVGFARAGRIMDLLEQRGVVGPSIGSKAREVLVTADELEARQSD